MVGGSGSKHRNEESEVCKTDCGSVFSKRRNVFTGSASVERQSLPGSGGTLCKAGHGGPLLGVQLVVILRGCNHGSCAERCGVHTSLWLSVLSPLSDDSVFVWAKEVGQRSTP